MLYVTTRSKVDTYTAHNALCNDRAVDGGAFVPFQLPELTRKQIAELKNKSFGQCVADVLNLFFSVRLDGLDVDFCVGKNPVQLKSMSHKIIIAETWHNPEQTFAKTARSLADRIGGEVSDGVSDWVGIAVRIAVLFGLYGQMLRECCLEEGQLLDVAVPTGDFSAPMAVWYAREMGLPVGTIVCGCDGISCVWDLLHHGEMRTGDGVPANLERLIYATLGFEQTGKYCLASEKSGIYSLDDEETDTLAKGLSAAVVSEKRMESVINSVYRTNTYLLEPDGALAFAGLQDYRTGAGETRPALILTERSPLCAADAVAAAIGVTVQELKSRTDPT